MVTTLPAPDILGPAIGRALAARVVVTTFNSGANDFASVGSFIHASVDEHDMGRTAADHFEAGGVTGPVLRVIHEAQNIGLVERCESPEDSYGGGMVEQFSVAASGTADLPRTEQALRGGPGSRHPT